MHEHLFRLIAPKHHEYLDCELPKESSRKLIKKQQKSQTKLSDTLRRNSLIQILRIEHKEGNRTRKQIRLLIELLKEQPFFVSIAHNYKVLQEVSAKMQYVRIAENNLIYKAKDKADSFYIILNGEVSIKIPEQIQEDSEVIQINAQIIQTQKELLSSFLLERQEIKQKMIEPQIQEINQDKIIRVLEPGDCFGQMLSEEENIRVTNAFSTSNCDLILIKKKHYESLFRALLKTENNSKFKFLYRIPLFQILHPFTVESIVFYIEEIAHTYGSYLFKEKEPIQYIYIIKEGEFKMHKEITKMSRQLFTRNVKSKSQYQKITQPKKIAPFRIIYPGEILGETETFERITQYSESCICESQEALVYRVEKRKFFKKILSEENDFNIVKNIIESKWKRQNLNITTFVKKRTGPTLINYFLNEEGMKRDNNKSLNKFVRNSFQHRTVDSICQEDSLFFNQFHKTIQKSIKNRFSVHRVQKCKTEASHTNSQPTSILKSFKKKKKLVPKAIRDIVELVTLKAKFQKKCRTNRIKTDVFQFDHENVPIFIKNRFNHLLSSSQVESKK